MEPSSKLIGFDEAPPIENPTMPVADIPWSPPPIDPLPEVGDTERAKLIDRLREKAEQSEADSTYWACLWLSDIECLRGIVRSVESYQPNANSSMIGNSTFTMLRAWQTRPRNIALSETQGKRKLGEETPKRKLSAKTATTLHLFWPKDQVDGWEARLTGPNGTELCENLLCLSPDAHRLWGACYFALQPLHLRDDGKELITRFYWLPEFTPRNVQV
ncbi:hypothetical protein N7516_005412 [Penicillium verrucosum]|uniref:uncharacterized protein n=1 Tax=Penicillium verrucosum TaxID=60171 RepID=UPI002544DDDF|nr:uncharacterized protein N7516_005412 [Penicillium verrucosum]KAJ5945244.1 hypothetical protein N7516_005412 [Penicillium verrucosum]